VLCVLCLSANSSFVDFPRVCRLVASDDFLHAEDRAARSLEANPLSPNSHVCETGRADLALFEVAHEDAVRAARQ
jgi:hypothetical protein